MDRQRITVVVLPCGAELRPEQAGHVKPVAYLEG
jgi:hypothetical protein